MQRMNVGQIKNHPDYNDVTTNNDFALLRLKKAVDFCTHSHIRPICLPTDTSESFAGVDAIVTGWGTTSSGGSLSSSMLEVTLKVLTNNQCKNDYSYASSMITSKMLCANVDGVAGQGSARTRPPRTPVRSDEASSHPIHEAPMMLHCA